MPIKNIPIFPIAFINILEARSPVSSNTAQNIAATQESWYYCTPTTISYILTEKEPVPGIIGKLLITNS